MYSEEEIAADALSDSIFVAYDDGTQVTLDVFDAPGWTLPMLADALIPDMEAAEWAVSQRRDTYPGGDAVVISASKGELSTKVYLFLYRGKELVITCVVTQAGDAERLEPVFEQIAESLTLPMLASLFPAPPQPCAPEWDCEKPYTEFGDGLYEVGVDITPGLYESYGFSDGCYWAAMRGTHRGAEDIISDGITSIVVVKSSDDYFLTRGCGRWYEVPMND